ncbi:cubilin-like [Saccostrea echinata]|uniref:cubilin-like n=1 Tax=Saccostrea echinata TaxID=191078 RepID=UPI002A7F10CC|nr:cubilin-like [Saccostrea echinata]
MSKYEDFGESFWNSTSCSTTCNNITILTETTVYIRLNISSPLDLFHISRYECNRSFTDLVGNIFLQFPKEQLHVTSVVCKYTIELPKYYSIDLKIKRVILRENETLIVRDRRSEIKNIVGTYSNVTTFRIMNTSYIELEYQSISGGFYNSPMILNVSWSYCGGIFNNTVNFSASNESGAPVNVDCLFLLERKPAEKFDFLLTDFSLTTTNCEKDFLQLYDVEGEGQLLKQYCNNSRGDITHISTNRIMLRLFSTGSALKINFSGKALPREGCGQSVFYHKGQILNPTNTLASSCRYSINTQKNSRIMLVLNNVSLPERNNGICTDYLQITDVSSTTSTTQRYCGDKYHHHKLLSGNRAFIMFHTNGNQDDSNARFHIEFTECGGYFDGYSGEIKGFKLSGDKSISEKCLWRIGHLTPRNITIRSNNNFSDYCNKSVKLSITENKTIQLCNHTSNFLKTFGNVEIEIPLSVLMSDSPSLTWIACGTVEKARRGLTFVDLVLYEYLNTSCPLILDASDTDSYILYLIITNNDCLEGFMIDDYRYNLTDLNTTIFHFPSPVNMSYLPQNNTRQQCRLQVHWEACNQTFTGENGTFTSPGYPDKYFINQTCFYIITAPIGQHINLTFKDFDVGKSTNDKKCGGDRVEIHDSGYVGSHDDIHCGKQDKDELIQYLSSGHSITLRFVSRGNQGSQFKGFNVSYEFFEQGMSTLGQTDHSEYHDIKKGLLSYRTSLATTVAMGVCIGVLVFVVIALAGFLVRQKGCQSAHAPVLPQESNASTSDMNVALSPQKRKQGYIKKKDSNGLSTPIPGNRQSSLNRNNENSNKHGENRERNQTKENGIYNHLHEGSNTSTTQKKDVYSFVSHEDKGYSKCGLIPKKFEILGDTVYNTSKTTPTSTEVTMNENKDIVSETVENYGNLKVENCVSLHEDAKNDNSLNGDKLDVDKDDVKNLESKHTSDTDKSKRKSGVKKKIRAEKDLRGISEENKSVHGNIDTNSNEYGNWEEISAKRKETNTFIAEEDEFYSNTASIYSNDIQEDVYSNGSSVL